MLGVISSRDCSFTAHVDSVIRKGNASLQTLSIMRHFGYEVRSLLRAYLCYVRPFLEQAPSSTAHYSPCAKKRSVRIILGSRDIPYQQAPITLNIQCPEQRLCNLIMRFGKALLLDPAHRDILRADSQTKFGPDSRTRQKSKLIPIHAQTNRYYNSFVSFFTSTLNSA